MTFAFALAFTLALALVFALAFLVALAAASDFEVRLRSAACERAYDWTSLMRPLESRTT